MLDKKVILFDLDGTLLSMDQEDFIKEYFKGICASVKDKEASKVISAIWDGTKKMYENDGSATNENVFYNEYRKIFGEAAFKDKEIFNKYYSTNFNEVKKVGTVNVDTVNLIKKLKDNGKRLVVATNPLFPMIAQINRIKWAGLDPNDFEYITSYENCSFTKPNINYYKALLNELKVEIDDCLMVGNDVDEDIVPTKLLKMDNFLITDHMINKSATDISKFNKGTFKDLTKYIFD